MQAQHPASYHGPVHGYRPHPSFVPSQPPKPNYGPHTISHIPRPAPPKPVVAAVQEDDASVIHDYASALLECSMEEAHELLETWTGWTVQVVHGSYIPSCIHTICMWVFPGYSETYERLKELALMIAVADSFVGLLGLEEETDDTEHKTSLAKTT